MNLKRAFVIGETIALLSTAMPLAGATQYHGAISDYKIMRLTTQSGLSQSSVQCIYQDSYGFVWIGTKAGLNRYDGYGFDVYKYNPTTSNTLSNNEITCINGDVANNLYIGTRGGGLCRYSTINDEFTNLDDVVPSNSIVNDICFDSDSNLWICSEIGLLRGEPDDSSACGYKFFNVVRKAIYHSPNGGIMARTKNHVSTNCIYQLSANTFLVGTDRGLFIFRLRESIFRMVDIGSMSAAKISAIVRRNSTDFFIATSDGLVSCSWDGSALTPQQQYGISQPAGHHLQSDWVNIIVMDSTHTIWGGGRGGGLFSIDTNNVVVNYVSDIIDPNRISDHAINSLLIDRNGVLWIGTDNHGCNLLNLNHKHICRFDNIPGFAGNLNNDVITAITGNGTNVIYTGTASSGVSKITLTGNNSYVTENVPITTDKNDQNREVLSLYLDSHNNLWAGTLQNSITRISPNGAIKSFPTEGYVFSIFEDSKSNMWIGTWGDGFCKMDTETGMLTSFAGQNSYQSISSDRVLSFAEDSYGNLWIGTKGGGVNVSPINLLSQGLSNFVSYTFDATTDGSISHNDVYCIHRDSRGTMWIGTGHGLNRFVLPDGENPVEAIMQNKGTFVSYTEEDGLPNSTILGMLEDNSGYLWVSTTNGLARVSTIDYTISLFSKNDGLQDDEFHSNAYYKDDDGLLYFGGSNGVSFFNPDDMSVAVDNLDIRITALKIMNQLVRPHNAVENKVVLETDIAATRNITLWPVHKDFSIEFSALDYINMDNMRYAYRLIGYDDTWRITSRMQHSATYTNLREGKYTFQVRAISSTGVWSDAVDELHIVMKPVLWRNPWVFMLYLCFVMVLLFFFRKYSIIAVKEKNNLKLEAYEKQKAVELTESKMRFFTNISHEIRTPLALIYGPLDNVLQTQQLSSDVRADLQLVKKNVVRLLGLTNKLLQLRKIDMGEVEPEFESVHFIPYMKDRKSVV